MADRKEWKEQLLSKLLDQYEKSVTYVGENKVKQVFSVKPSDIFKGYNKDFLPPEQLFQEKEFERLIRQMESGGTYSCSSSEYWYSPSDLCRPGTLERLLCLPEPDRKEYSKKTVGRSLSSLLPVRFIGSIWKRKASDTEKQPCKKAG